jgi:hypothetical protein
LIERNQVHTGLSFLAIFGPWIEGRKGVYAMKPHFSRNLSLVSAIALVLAAVATGLSAAPPPKEWQEHKEYICHAPPGNPDNPQMISISKNALDAHSGHPDDWITGIGECHGNPTGLAALPVGFAAIACINRTGKRMGRWVDTDTTGRVASRRMGCEI